MAPSSVTPYLTDIIEAIEHIREKAGTTPLDAFRQDWERQWIVQRGLEIVSEASRRLPDALKARYPGIPGRRSPPSGTFRATNTGRFRRPSYGREVAREQSEEQDET